MLNPILFVTVFYGNVQSGEILWVPGNLEGLHGLVKFNRILIHGRNLLKVRRDYEEPNPPCYFLLMRHEKHFVV